MKKYLALFLLTSLAQAADWSREVAPADGWAAMEGGTRGGAEAVAANVFKVTTIEELRSALKKAGTAPKIIQVQGPLDATDGKPFAGKTDQAARSEIRLTSNTTLIGTTPDAGFINTGLMLRGVDNVIIRNLRIENPWDEYPQWDPNDGPTGHWNAEYDSLTIDQSRHVWVDHVSFSDGRRTDDQNGLIDGHEVQHHDGALDIKNASDFVTISYCVFDQHDKNNLIGHSDSKKTDAGHLTITLHHNLFQNVIQRAPRVRYGMVHLYNNYHTGDRKQAVYPLQYSHGVGLEARMISENNVFDIANAKSACDVVKSFGGTRYQDSGSLLNGAKLDISAGCKGDKGSLVLFEPAGWQPPYRYTLQPASAVAATVKTEAGKR